MRYLCIALLANACILAGCASAPKTAANSSQENRAEALRYSAGEIQSLIRSGKIWLERDTATNGWLYRDSAGVVLTGVALADPSPEPGPKYGDCLAK